MKVYVEVLVWYTAEGRVVPVSFLWEDGHRYQIERVKNVQRCASRKEGGCGIMYTRISILAAFIPVILFYMAVNRDNMHGGNIFSDLRYRMQQKKRQKEWRDQWK